MCATIKIQVALKFDICCTLIESFGQLDPVTMCEPFSIILQPSSEKSCPGPPPVMKYCSSRTLSLSLSFCPTSSLRVSCWGKVFAASFCLRHCFFYFYCPLFFLFLLASFCLCAMASRSSNICASCLHAQGMGGGERYIYTHLHIRMRRLIMM